MSARVRGAVIASLFALCITTVGCTTSENNAQDSPSVVSTQISPSTGDSTAGPSLTASSPATTPTRDATPTPTHGPTVDPSTFAAPEMPNLIAFTDPTGRIFCGAYLDGSIDAGCHMSVVQPKLPSCSNPDTNAPLVVFHQGTVSLGCTNQGYFVFENQKELPMGSSVTIGDFVFTSVPEGISAVQTSTGARFTVGPTVLTTS